MEQVTACIFRFAVTKPDLDEYLKRLIIGVRDTHPDIFAEWCEPGGAKRKRLLTQKFGSVGVQLHHDGYGAAEIGPKQMTMLGEFGTKLTRALYYKHVGYRLQGRVFSELVSFINNQAYLDEALGFAPKSVSMVSTSVNLGDQFVYRFNSDSRKGILYAVVKIGEQQGYRLFGFSHATWEDLKALNPKFAEGFEKMAENHNRLYCATV